MFAVLLSMYSKVDNVGAERMSSGRLFRATGPAMAKVGGGYTSRVGDVVRGAMEMSLAGQWNAVNGEVHTHKHKNMMTTKRKP